MRSLPWQDHRFAILYICIAIALLTLNPFQFQTYDPTEWWVWRFWLTDILQNILLFLPFGLLLRYSLGLPYHLCLLWGFCFSFSIETTQLFIQARTSNWVDLIANSAGSLGGAALYSLGFNEALQEPGDPHWFNLSLAIMLIPLCWVRAIATELQFHAAWAMLPSAIVLLLLLRSTNDSPPLLNKTQTTALLLALLPLIAHRPLVFILVVSASIILYKLFSHWRVANTYLTSLGILGMGLGLIIHSNIAWLWHEAVYAGETWYKLRWIEILLSTIVVATTCIYYKQSKSQRG